MKRIVIGMLIIFFLVGCSSKQDENKIVVVLDWSINTNHTGLYVAQKKGYFKDAGLDVEIVTPPEDGALSLLATNKAQFGFSFQEELAFALDGDNKMPISAVASIVNHNRSGLVSLKEKKITSPRKMENKRLASWSSDVFDAIVRQVVEDDGGNYDKVIKINTNVSDPLAALNSTIDVIWSYYSWDVISLKKQNIAINYLEFKKLNPIFDFYTPILVGNDEYIKAKPEHTQKFLAALTKGYKFAIDNPNEAADILLEYAPELDKKLVYASQEYLAQEYQSDAKYWGEIDHNRWNNFYQWLEDKKLVKSNIQNKGLNTTFMEEINNVN